MKLPEEGVAHNLGDWLQRHPATFLIGVVALSMLLMNLFPGETYSELVIQSIILALFVVLSLFLFNKTTLNVPAREEMKYVAGKSVYLFFIALVAGVFLYLYLQKKLGVYQEGWGGRIVPFIVLCIGTGLFEEGLFRGVAFRVISDELKGRKDALLKAALISSLLFGAFHNSVSVSGADFNNTVVVVQMILKPIQAALFGFFVAALFARTGNVWLIAGVHALNNFLMMMPSILFTGTIAASYLTGNVIDVIILATTVVLYLPLTIVAVNMLKNSKYSV